MKATVTELFTYSALACQRLGRENSSVENATLVGTPESTKNARYGIPEFNSSGC